MRSRPADRRRDAKPADSHHSELLRVDIGLAAFA